MNEEKKDFNAMLHNSKDMPKIKTIDKEEVVSRYGGRKMLLAPPIDYDKVIKRIPHGKTSHNRKNTQPSCLSI